MGEPYLMTERQYFRAWEQYNAVSRPYNEMQEAFFAFMFVFGFGGVVAAETYGHGHSRSGPTLMFFFMGAFVVCLLINVIMQRCKRQRYKLWEKYFPYDPEREFSTEHFQKNIHHVAGCRPRRIKKGGKP